MQIALDSVNLATKGTPRLVDVSLEVPDGSFVSVLGASGAGKSTLLGVVSGLIPQDGGRVLFDGQPVDDLPAHRRDVAVVFQDARLFPNMNALDNVAFPLKVRGVGRKERRERAAKMLAQVQLEDMGQRGVHELSGGQRQRVALARALVADTRAAGTRLEDAARTLGAGRLRTLFHVTLPAIAPGLVSSMSMGYILSFSQYFLTLLIGGGQVKTFALVLFPYLAGGDRTVAGAYGLAFILITLVVFALFELLLRKVRPVQEGEFYGG